MVFCCVGKFGSIGKSTILVCKLAKSKKSALCWSADHHMAKMASLKKPSWKFKIPMLNGQVHFWCKCNRYKPVTFKITCQSSQGHLLSRESIDFLGYCSCLLEKVKGRGFKCKLTEFVSWDFKHFWFQCKVNGKFGIWSPMSSYMYCKGTQN